MGRRDPGTQTAGLTGPGGGDPLSASAFALIGVNLIPLVGVFWWDWDAFTVILLYWLETAVIGVITMLRIVSAGGDLKAMGERILQQARGKVSECRRWGDFSGGSNSSKRKVDRTR